MIPARCCSTSSLRASPVTASVFICAALAGCGGGFHSSGSTPSSGGSPVSVQVSGTSPLSSSCGSTVPTGTTETYTLGSGIQPQIAAIPQGAVVGVWEQDRWTGYGARAIMIARSTNSGAAWSTPTVLPFSNCGGGSGVGATYDRASDPWISFGGNGTVYASALAFSANGFTATAGFSSTGGPSAVLVSRSADGGSTWTSPVAVWADPNSGAAPFYFNDRDSITADPSSGNVYVVWDRLNSTGSTSVPAYLARSTDGGASWTSGILYDPLGTNEAFNNEIAILTSGTVLDFFTLLSSGTSTLQLVTLTFSGTGWTASSPVTVATIQSVGTSNPIPLDTPIRDSSLLAQVAVDSASGGNGAVAAVWQQSFSSSAFDGIALSVSTDSGTTWSTPVQVNGVTSVAAFSPTVRYLPNGVLAVTYYDLRNYVSGSSVLSTTAWLTESSDGGTTWHEVQLQNQFDLNSAPLADDTKLGFGSTALFLGDNQGLALVGSNPLPFYAATTSAGAHVYATQPPNPLTSSSAHTYSAAALGRPTAAAVARASANAERMRLRGVGSAGRQ
jgi:hypothetical protein